MRNTIIALGCGVALLLLAGCGPGRKPFVWPTGDQKDQRPRLEPTAESLVAEINQNAKLIQSVESRELFIQASAGMQTIGLNGAISAQKPRNFRLQAKAFGKPAVDMGSNDQEFWYWVMSQGEANPLVYCSYKDLADGKARMPFPFQPEWIIETLGMSERNPQATYTMVPNKNTYDLVEQTTSPQGQPVRKVTQFSRKAMADGRYQVVGHYLQDAKNETICSAHITDMNIDKGGALVPRRIQLSWPAEKMQLDMTMDRQVVNNPIDQNRAAALFLRPNLGGGIRSIDMARALSQPMGYVQQTGSYQQPYSYPPRR